MSRQLFNTSNPRIIKISLSQNNNDNLGSNFILGKKYSSEFLKIINNHCAFTDYKVNKSINTKNNDRRQIIIVNSKQIVKYITSLQNNYSDLVLIILESHLKRKEIVKLFLLANEKSSFFHTNFRMYVYHNNMVDLCTDCLKSLIDNSSEHIEKCKNIVSSYEK